MCSPNHCKLAKHRAQAVFDGLFNYMGRFEPVSTRLSEMIVPYFFKMLDNRLVIDRRMSCKV